MVNQASLDLDAAPRRERLNALQADKHRLPTIRGAGLGALADHDLMVRPAQGASQRGESPGILATVKGGQ